MKLSSFVKNWFKTHAHSPHAQFWLGVLSFADSSFFPIPPDPLLMGILAAQPKRWVWFSFFTSVTSVAGSLLGYAIGFWFFDLLGEPLIQFYNLESQLEIARNMFLETTFITMFIAAFTPIPYKLLTIAGGLFSVALTPFILGSLVGRGLRFFLVGFLMRMFGKKIADIVLRYLNISLVIIVVLLVALVAFKLL